MIFPSIDLMNSKVVQLVQGERKNKKIELDNPLEIARKFSKYTIQLIDLDAAMGKGDNLRIIKILCKQFKCRVGGGIRTVERAEEIIKAGAKKVIIGSSAFKDNKLDVIFLILLNMKIG